ncbi:Transcriptional attenuator, LytR family [Hyella patelloides LEGE 07179]|uniref:Transcriptional attenuator, LytR family n=1 Tax=Hyella patelloides LEGE 07179 TaxID=945734 RepID=A0A563VJS5_9CYAN|nr:LCP family protein [Hyella patelloides]VEP11694.1 Transcriptional attenuator, LytR family [Hyella patelloides LEGE 07179]
MSVNKVYRPTPSGPKSGSKSGQKVTPKARYRPKKSYRGRNIAIGIGLTVVSFVSAAAGALLAVTFSESAILKQAELTPEEEQVFNQENTVARKNLSVPELTRPVNILVLGIKVLTSDLKNQPVPDDLGYHALVNSFEGLSDTMLLVRFDPQQKKLSVLSIPRDTKVYLDGHGDRKINHANDYGGPALTASAVSELLGGVEIDRYVRVNVQGIEKLIDALGGVNVFVPKDMKYNDFSQHLYIDLKKGQQHLDGEKAVQFLRYRYDDLGDISRVQRQQVLMRALVEQALKPRTIVKVPKILDVIKSHLDTNLTVKELMALSNFASQTERSGVQMMMLPGNFNNPEENVSYWVPDSPQIENIMVQHFELEPAELDSWSDRTAPTQRDFTNTRIAIQNSLEDPTAARQMLNALQEAGYSRAYISRDWAEPLRVTKIVAQKGDTMSAETLKATLGVGEVLVESTGSLESDVTIQVGEDWQDYLAVDELGTDDFELEFDN